MQECDVKIGMKVQTPDLLRDKNSMLVVIVKRIMSYKDYIGRSIYEVEGATMDRFHRPYNYITQRLAEEMEVHP